MTTSSEHNGHLLNHIELFYRPGERALAAQFFETLRCTVVDVTKQFGASATYMCVFPGATQPDPLNNVLYLSETRDLQPLNDLLVQRMQDDPELRAVLEQHELLRTKPGQVMHFGLRYPTFEELESLIDALDRRLPAGLVGRVTVHPAFAVELQALGTEVLQGFVQTDVVGAGLFPFGQLIELQAQRPLTGSGKHRQRRDEPIES